MSNMHTLGVVTPSGTTTVAMVQGEPNPASDAVTSIDMEIDKNNADDVTTDVSKSRRSQPDRVQQQARLGTL
jgi:hypothetical protein